MTEHKLTAETTSADDDFVPEFRAAIRHLRAVLDAAIRGSGVEPDRPQEIARHCRLDKNLAWKVSRLIGATDPTDALRFVPGQNGLRIVAERLGEVAGSAAQAALLEAIDAFGRLTARHAGDRATLELLVLGTGDGLPPADLLEGARRQAYNGNSAILGYRARRQVTVWTCVPSSEQPGAVDLVEVGGLLGFVRLRSEVRVPLLRLPGALDSEPLVPADQPRGMPLLRPFCSVPLPRVERHVGRDGESLELGAGPVGGTAREDCVFGLRAPLAPASHARGEPPTCALRLPLTTPVESLVVAILIDRELRWTPDPTPRLTGIVGHPGSGPVDAAAHEGQRLPVERQLESTDDLVEALVAQDGEPLPETVRFVLRALGRGLGEFEQYRLELPFPPIPSSLAVRFARPADDE